MGNISSESRKTCFRKYLEKLNRPNIDDFMLFGHDKMLVAFLRDQTAMKISSVYDLNDRIACEKARNDMQHFDGLKTENEMSQLLKYYAAFLEDPKFNPELNSQKIKKPKDADKKPQIIIKDMTEGSKVHTEYERRYRNPELRKKCIEEYGFVCQVCGFDFAKAYGEELGGGFIEVHHLEPISTFAEEHEVDPLRDLVPLCSNCHSMIHHGKNGTLTLNELREAYKGKKWDISKTKEQ